MRRSGCKPVSLETDRMGCVMSIEFNNNNNNNNNGKTMFMVLSSSLIATTRVRPVHLDECRSARRCPIAVYSPSRVQRLRTRLKFGERAFSVDAPPAWNRLPTELKLMRSTPAFKRCMKTFFFKTAYSSDRTNLTM